MVALGASNGLEMHKMDITTLFLYAPLEEEVFIEQPEGSVEPGKMMRLLKCQNGRKQASRKWNIYIVAM